MPELITVAMHIYTNARGRRSVLKTEEQLHELVTFNRKRCKTIQSQIANIEDADERANLYQSLDNHELRIAEYQEYLDKLPEFQASADLVRYAVEVPEYNTYIEYEEQARQKDGPKAQGQVVLTKLMAIMLPHCTYVEDKENPTGFRKLGPAEFNDKEKGVKKYVADVLWENLFLALNPDISILPTK